MLDSLQVKSRTNEFILVDDNKTLQIENIYVGNHGTNPLNYIKNSIHIKDYHKIEFYFEPKGYTNSAMIIIHDTRTRL